MSRLLIVVLFSLLLAQEGRAAWIIIMPAQENPAARVCGGVIHRVAAVVRGGAEARAWTDEEVASYLQAAIRPEFTFLITVAAPHVAAMSSLAAAAFNQVGTENDHVGFVYSDFLLCTARLQQDAAAAITSRQQRIKDPGA